MKAAFVSIVVKDLSYWFAVDEFNAIIVDIEQFMERVPNGHALITLDGKGWALRQIEPSRFRPEILHANSVSICEEGNPILGGFNFDEMRGWINNYRDFLSTDAAADTYLWNLTGVSGFGWSGDIIALYPDACKEYA